MRVQGEKKLEVDLTTKAPFCHCRYRKISDANPLLMEILRAPSKAKVPGKKKRIKFPGLYEKLCRLLGSYRININHLRETRRICDGILTTKTANYLIEAKYNKGRLQPHQKITQDDINSINGSYFVVRRVLTVKSDGWSVNTFITIEQPEKNVLARCDNVIEVFEWFNARGEAKI